MRRRARSWSHGRGRGQMRSVRPAFASHAIIQLACWSRTGRYDLPSAGIHLCRCFPGPLHLLLANTTGLLPRSFVPRCTSCATFRSLYYARPPHLLSLHFSGMETPTCPLLALPAELRSAIYELAFTCDHDPDSELDLFQARPPAKDLLLTSRQIYEEARQIYTASYRGLWKTSKFVVGTDTTNICLPDAKKALLAIRSADLDHIANLAIFRPIGDIITPPPFISRDSRGGWVLGNQRFGLFWFVCTRRSSGRLKWTCLGSEDELRWACEEATQTLSMRDQIHAILCSDGASSC